MSFISYAQNLEDVILSRIFKNVRKGFYIDVGANDPVIDSVTKAFYDGGWRGINIEPVYQCYQRLCAERPADINLPIAVGNEDSFYLIYEIPDAGFSTFDSAIAEHHQYNGRTVIKRKIAVMTLSAICRQYVKEPICFLKVDVAGTEKQALQGMDFQQYRPWIVVVDTTLPLGQKQSYAGWEHIFLDNGYQYAYFDGLNRFYIAEEKTEEIKPYFSSPPNCFDGYLRYAEYCLQCEKNKLMQENQKLVEQKHHLQEELSRMEERNRIYANRSRRNTAPLQPVHVADQEQVALLTQHLQQEISRRLESMQG